MADADRTEYVLVGRFGAPHGVRGDIRVQSFTQQPEAIGSYGPLRAADGRRFVFRTLRRLKDNMLVVRVEGIGDRSAAEALRHVDLFIPRTALPAPEDDEFYVADLVGLEAVTEDGIRLGTVIDVPNYGGGDLIEVRPDRGGETLLYPFTRQVVPAIDVASRRVTVVPPDEIEAAPTDDPADP